MTTLDRLKQEAQAVLDVIENPDVAQALRQDKIQNLQYLKDNYKSPRTPTQGRRYEQSVYQRCTIRLA